MPFADELRGDPQAREQLVQRALEGLQEPSPDSLGAAYSAALLTPDPRLLGPALALLRHPDPLVVRMGVRILGILGNREALYPLLRLLERPPNLPRNLACELQAAVLEALGRLGDPRALPALEEALKRQGFPDPCLRVRRWHAWIALLHLAHRGAEGVWAVLEADLERAPEEHALQALRTVADFYRYEAPGPFPSPLKALLRRLAERKGPVGEGAQGLLEREGGEA